MCAHTWPVRLILLLILILKWLWWIRNANKVSIQILLETRRQKLNLCVCDQRFITRKIWPDEGCELKNVQALSTLAKGFVGVFCLWFIDHKAKYKLNLCLLVSWNALGCKGHMCLPYVFLQIHHTSLLFTAHCRLTAAQIYYTLTVCQVCVCFGALLIIAFDTRMTLLISTFRVVDIPLINYCSSMIKDSLNTDVVLSSFLTSPHTIHFKKNDYSVFC